MCFLLRDRFRSAYLKTALLASAPKQPGGWLASPSSRRRASSCPAPLRGVLLPGKGGTSHRLLDAVPLPPVSQHHSTIPTPPKRYDAMTRVHASMGSQGLRSTLLGALSLKAWGNPFTADAALMYDTLCVPGKASRAAEKDIGVGDLAVPDGGPRVLRRISSRTYHGALGGPTPWSWRRGDTVSGRFRRTLETGNVASFTLSNWRHVPTP
jgi:hypothetical protein